MKPGNRKAIFIVSMGITIASLFAVAGKHHFNQHAWRNGCHQHACSETRHEKQMHEAWDGKQESPGGNKISQ